MWPENVSSIGYWEATELFLGEKAAMFDSGVWDTKKFEQSDFAEDIYFGWGPTYTDGVGNQEISMKPASHPYVVSGKLQKEDPEKMCIRDSSLNIAACLICLARRAPANRKIPSGTPLFP